MNEYATGAIVDPRELPRYRIQIRNPRGGGERRMFVCTNFIVTRYNEMVISNLQGKLQKISLEAGDYFDVKVMR